MNEPWLRGREYLEITTKQFEISVLTWLKNCHQTLNDFAVIHSNVVTGDSGEYEIDIEFTIFNEAKITVLVECKRYRNPVMDQAKLITLRRRWWVLHFLTETKPNHEALLADMSFWKSLSMFNEIRELDGYVSRVSIRNKSVVDIHHIVGSALGNQLTRA